MTTEELRHKFNTEFEMGEWPKTYGVDHETYANVCQFVFNKKLEAESGPWIPIAVGVNGGILFKNVELILTVVKEK